jgi:hypothetical protein
VRKALVALITLAALLIPATAVAVQRPAATLPDRQLDPLAAYDLEIGLLIGTVQNPALTNAAIRQTSDTTSEVQGQLCGAADPDGGTDRFPFCTAVHLTYTYALDCFTGTFRVDALSESGIVGLDSPVTFPNTLRVTHVSFNPLRYDFTAADAKHRKAVCSAKQALTDPKNPPTTTEEVAILNDLIDKLQSP